MSDQKVSVLGLLIAAGFILNGVGVFTPAWLVDTVSAGGYSISASAGIVPFYSANLGWFNAASILMYFTFAEFILMAFMYCIIFSRVHKNGYSCGLRRSFYSMALGALVIVGFTVTSVILIGVNMSSLGDYWQKWTLGYSAWLCIVSAATCVGIFGLSIHIATRDCH